MVDMLKRVDFGILYTMLVILAVGGVIFFSAILSSLYSTDEFMNSLLKQSAAIFFGLFGMYFVLKSKKLTGTFLKKWSFYLFLGAIIIQALVFVPSLGVEYNGALRWVNFGFVSFQPSEVFKYFFIIFFSATLLNFSREIVKFKGFLFINSIFFIPITILFVVIHDFGTLLTILAASFVVLLQSRVKKKYLFSVVLIAFVFGGFLSYAFVPYVQERIDIYHDLLINKKTPKTYHNRQMIYTIGSGRLSGRGWGASMQKYSGLVPEAKTDSIFPIFAEEWGFFGSSFLIILFTIFSFFILRRAKKIKNKFEKMIVSGIGILIIFPAFYNIGVAMGVLPFSGMPMTFISKGGTSLLLAIIMTGVLLRVAKKR